MKRKILALMLAACLSFCLVSCNKIEQNVNINTYDEQVNATLSQQNEENNYESNINNENVYPQQSSQHENEQTNPPQTSVKTTTKHITTTTTQKKITTTTKAAHNHSFSAANCTQAQKCSCGATIGSPLGHSYSAATCTSPKKCTRCGATSGSALGHNYQSGKCTRCGKTDPNSLPVPLNQLYLTDSDFYKYLSGSFMDSFGNTYNGAYAFNHTYQCRNGREPHCTFSLNNKYSSFSGSIVATTAPKEGYTYYVNIYVDNVLKFSKTGYSKATGKIDFNINVKNGQILKIAVGAEQNSGGSQYDVAIVNAQLKK